MRILSIDYGASTGMAFGSWEDCCIYKMYLGTHNKLAMSEGAYPVPEECDCIILEQAPFGAKWNTSAVFHTLLHDIQRSGYRITRELKPKGIVFVAPSQWKPFVKKQQPDLSSWSPKTKHERDAMSMLWYVISMQNKKENYVFRDK